MAKPKQSPRLKKKTQEAPKRTKTVDKSTGARKKLIVIGLCSFGLLAILLMFSGEQTPQSFTEEDALVMQNAKVSVQEVALQSSYTKSRKVYGLVEPTTQANLGFELAGVVAELLVKEGDVVTKGQALAKLDILRLQAQKEEVAAALKRAKADATLAQISSERVAELVSAKLESSQRLDEANANLDAANALVNEVSARSERITVEVEKSTLRAPFDGQIVSQLLDEGTVVNSGDTLFSLLAQSQLEARIGLPTQTPLALKIGQSYSLAFNELEIESTLVSISQQRNRATRAIDAIFTIDEAGADSAFMMPGDIVSLSVDVTIQKSGTWVPTSALGNGVRGLWTLFVVSEVDSEQHIQPRSVQVEYVKGDRAYVSGAIKDGEKLVINGIQRLTPNQVVSNVVANTVVAK